MTDAANDPPPHKRDLSDQCDNFGVVVVGSFIPTTLYRFVDREEYADELTRGTVRLTTLSICRGIEDQARGDPHDGMQYYYVAEDAGHGSDSGFRARAKRAGIGLGPETGHVTIRNGLSIDGIRDAWLLCTADKYEPESMTEGFGRYCVRIKEPRTLFRQVTKHMCRMKLIQPPAKLGRVTYGNPITTGLQPAAGQIGFVKRPDKYGYQAEFRMLFHPRPGIVVDRLKLEAAIDPSIVERIA